ncbi:uncharacterized protein G2W53_014160 [Senna tora]|uniref:Uncharacterized protein n=1 Tax=Senna tora TaxID=362788 RepID=A0A835C7H8_9FABA|nr:uncharacterized protein G2W53_014160 [Senna tora]
MLGQTHSRCQPYRLGAIVVHLRQDGCSSSFKVILYETSLNHFGALRIAHSSGSTEVILAISESTDGEINRLRTSFESFKGSSILYRRLMPAILIMPEKWLFIINQQAEVQKLKNARANSLPLHNALYLAEFAFYNTARQLELGNPSLQIGEIDYLKEPFGQVVKGRIPEADGPLLLKRGLADPLRWLVEEEDITRGKAKEKITSRVEDWDFLRESLFVKAVGMPEGLIDESASCRSALMGNKLFLMPRCSFFRITFVMTEWLFMRALRVPEGLIAWDFCLFGFARGGNLSSSVVWTSSKMWEGVLVSVVGIRSKSMAMPFQCSTGLHSANKSHLAGTFWPPMVGVHLSHTNSLRKGESTIFSFHRRYQERERAPALERSRRSRKEAVRDRQRRTTSVTTPLTIQNRSTPSTRPSTLVKHHCKPPRTSHCSLARPSS